MLKGTINSSLFLANSRVISALTISAPLLYLPGDRWNKMRLPADCKLKTARAARAYLQIFASFAPWERRRAIDFQPELLD
jgi:hypothetical protein